MSLLKAFPNWGRKLEVYSTLSLQVHVGTTHQLGAKLEAFTAGALNVQVHASP